MWFIALTSFTVYYRDFDYAKLHRFGNYFVYNDSSKTLQAGIL